MNKIEVINKLNELKKTNCQAVWFILKNRPHQGANFDEIINNEEKECIQLKKIEIYDTIFYSDIIGIEFTY